MQRLQARAFCALHAAVGLDDARRARVEQLLGARLRAPGMPPEQRFEVALTLAQFEIQDADLAGKVALALAEALSQTPDPNAFLQLAQALSVVTARMEPKQAAAVCGQAASTLIRCSDMLEPCPLGNRSGALSVSAVHRSRNEGGEA